MTSLVDFLTALVGVTLSPTDFDCCEVGLSILLVDLVLTNLVGLDLEVVYLIGMSLGIIRIGDLSPYLMGYRGIYPQMRQGLGLSSPFVRSEGYGLVTHAA